MNFILKYQGTDQPDLDQVCAILDTYHVQLLDNSLWPETALVNMEVSVLASLQKVLNQWHIYPEEEYQLPSPRKTIKKSH
ncbi:hypothetical protein HDF26_001538 [Pedobacter cryoconitis]|uniref:Uncharacterized protein n=1 Tax=Pedobacter cryoconitis TaxID=188932 RepID=A0A7W9E0P1_9SPHI|nr:hypothetical protein [Pedobacter cryoconitis]MBB5638168.1 hypothetical protein [Pedobacter cryoconitis]MBB6271111.1 hypothetical protein [Pedobacter cryoconitis]